MSNVYGSLRRGASVPAFVVIEGSSMTRPARRLSWSVGAPTGSTPMMRMPGRRRRATAPMPAQPSPTLHDGAPETMSEGRLMTPRAPAPRAVFPEWIGVSVTADDLDPRKGDKGLRAVQVAVGVGVLSIAIGIVWWLLSLL